MKLKIKKLHENAIIPSRSKEGDIGLDLTAISVTVVDKGGYGYVEYDTGISVEPEPGYYCLVYPRSSISNTGLWLANGVGLIDPGYTGSIKARFKYVPNTNKYNVGDRIAQLVIKKAEDVDIELVEELSQSERGEGGFGSSGL